MKNIIKSIMLAGSLVAVMPLFADFSFDEVMCTANPAFQGCVDYCTANPDYPACYSAGVVFVGMRGGDRAFHHGRGFGQGGRGAEAVGHHGTGNMGHPGTGHKK